MGMIALKMNDGAPPPGVAEVERAMLRLLLLRHAKAENASLGGSDHQRALTARGRADAARIGSYLARHGLMPDHVLLSTATRVQQTWDCAVTELADAPAAQNAPQLYNAAPGTILATVRGLPAGVRRPLLGGHNPGLHEAALLLTATGAADIREQLANGMPTAALAVIEFAASTWSDVHAQSGRLIRYVSPRLLEAATD
jgi:phosphohistidine phosphatase